MPSPAPRTILVTGSMGFIGRHLVRRLLEEGHTVVGLDLAIDEKEIRKLAEDYPGRFGLSPAASGHRGNKTRHPRNDPIRVGSLAAGKNPANPIAGGFIARSAESGRTSRRCHCPRFCRTNRRDINNPKACPETAWRARVRYRGDGL
jgi:NAD(P)-dependent dehydrogenase (short-subunit alcohol dehydrogenase family)